MRVPKVQSPANPSGRFLWLHRFARISFWFFLIKGLLWLVLPLAAIYLGIEA